MVASRPTSKPPRMFDQQRHPIYVMEPETALALVALLGGPDEGGGVYVDLSR